MRYVYLDNINISASDTSVINNFKVNVLYPDIEKFTNKNIKEKFITRLELSEDSLDPTYFCYGQKDILNKAQCNSPIEVDGNVKDYYTAWDKICLTNTDCPFYDKDKNKGGCSDSICEFPVGIKRLGFTKYSDEGQYSPFCYGCDNNDINCCKNQSNPDYVFPNDFDDRAKSGKETIVNNINYIF